MHAQNRGGAVSDCSASNGDFAHAVGRSGTITPRIDLGYRIGTERGRRCNPTIPRTSADKVSTLHRVVLQKKNPRPFGEGNPLSRHRRWHVGQSGATLTAMSVTPSETPRRLAGLAQFARAAFVGARHRSAAIVRGVPPAGRWQRRAVRVVLVQGLVHSSALLRAAGDSVRLRSRPRHSFHGGDRRSARL